MFSAAEFPTMKLAEDHHFCASPKVELLPKNMLCGFKKVQKSCMITWESHAVAMAS